MTEVINFFIEPYMGRSVTLISLEIVAFFFGIVSVVYAKQANILVYPTGLVATLITVYLLFLAELIGDMMMNFYYSIMSIYGWWNWTRRQDERLTVTISRTNQKDKIIGLVMFAATVGVTYGVYFFSGVAIGATNYIDIFTSGLFFTAMFYMASKKLENWTLWIIADIITVPLYLYRGWGFLSLQYLIFTILAIQGYRTWKNQLSSRLQTA
jgi:nicotinamide mononucleotide transporter